MSIQDIEDLLEKGDYKTLCELSLSEWSQVCSHVIRLRKMDVNWKTACNMRWRQLELGATQERLAEIAKSLK